MKSFRSSTKDKNRVFRRIVAHLDMLVEKKELDAYDRYFLISTTVKVVENLAEKYKNVVKGVKEVMMGSGIDYPGRDIYYEGRALGHEEGRGVGLKEGLAAGQKSLCKMCTYAKKSFEKCEKGCIKVVKKI